MATFSWMWLATASCGWLHLAIVGQTWLWLALTWLRLGRMTVVVHRHSSSGYGVGSHTWLSVGLRTRERPWRCGPEAHATSYGGTAMRHHMQVSVHKSTARGVHPRPMGQSKAGALGTVCVRARMAVVDCSGGKAHAKPLRCLRVSACVLVR